MGSIKRSLANNITTGGAFDATDLSGTIPSTNVADASLTNITTFGPALGDTIESVASDPSPLSEGQFWYNSTSGALKGLVQIKAWSAGGNMGTARRGLAGAGTQTTALGFGGFTTTVSNATEEYSGYTWTTGGNLGTARYLLAGAGTQTAGLGFGGAVYTPFSLKNNTEEYDGSAWTAGGNMGTARRLLAGAGLQTAGLAFGGDTSPGPVTNATEEYDGSSWTTGGNLSTARRDLGGAGTQTAGLGFGGYTTVNTNATEEYDGSAWTAGGSMNLTRAGLAGAGTQTAGLAFGGLIPPSTRSTATEEYDGTLWVISPTMATGRSALAGAGTRAAGLAFGGSTGSNTTATEEFNSSTQAFVSAAWSSGGNLPSAKRVGGSTSGGQITNSLIFGGDNVPMGQGIPQLKTTEEYDGSAWTAGGTIANEVSGSTGAGTQTAALGASGYSFTNGPGPAWKLPGASYIANAFEYDGSAWTNVTSLPQTRVGSSSFGIQTAAVIQGGSVAGNPGPEAAQRSLNTTLYDGTNWTTGSNLNVGHGRTQAAAGIQTAGIVFGGTTIPGTNGDNLESWDGTSWSSLPPGFVAQQGASGFGTQSLFVWAGGNNGPIPASPGTQGYNVGTYEWNGIAVSNTANTAQNHMISGSDGTVGTSTGFITGGSSSYTSNTTSTEEFTQGSSIVTASTITTS